MDKVFLTPPLHHIGWCYATLLRSAAGFGQNNAPKTVIAAPRDIAGCELSYNSFDSRADDLSVGFLEWAWPDPRRIIHGRVWELNGPNPKHTENSNV
jgi:hypothetical protein